MKNVTVTYHMRSENRPRTTAETCIDIPLKDDFAEIIGIPMENPNDERAMCLIKTICDALALLQGYDEAWIVDIRSAKDQR